MDRVAQSQAAALARQKAAKNKRNAEARAQEAAAKAARNAANAAAEKQAQLDRNANVQQQMARMRNYRLEAERGAAAEAQMLKENPALNASIKANKAARLVNVRKANGWGVGLGGRRTRKNRANRRNKTRSSRR
jgi:predicted methyltransferase